MVLVIGEIIFLIAFNVAGVSGEVIRPRGRRNERYHFPTVGVNIAA